VSYVEGLVGKSALYIRVTLYWAYWGPGSPHCRGITKKPLSEGLLWTSNQPVTDNSTWQHTTFRI